MASRLTEKIGVRANPLDHALICELGRIRGVDTPTLLRMIAVDAARKGLPVEAIERIERRYGGNNESQ